MSQCAHFTLKQSYFIVQALLLRKLRTPLTRLRLVPHSYGLSSKNDAEHQGKFPDLIL
jgi:hypothetical protein